MKKIIVLLLVLLFQFCSPLSATEAITASPASTLPPPEAGNAQIVFVKPTAGVFGDLAAHLFELKGTDREFLGMMGSKTKIIVNVDPGKHQFMSHMFTFAHFMEADLEAGKRYYVLVRFIYGKGFQLRPIKQDGPADFSPANPDFKSWLALTTEVKKTPEMDSINVKNKKYVDKAQTKHWPEWLAKTPEQRAELTLDKEDFLD